MRNKTQNSKLKTQIVSEHFFRGLATRKSWTVLVFLLIAAVLRLYRIGEYLTFLGDQGRDVLVVKRMLVDGDLTLLGPITSVGSIFLGPLYYYFMSPFLLLFNFDPVGPAIMVVLLSLATIYLLYRVSIEYFNFAVFFFAGVLYVTSPLVLIHSRFSWNPNAVPFFALLLVYSILKVGIDRRDRWMVVVGVSFGVLVQMHYLTLILLPFAAISLWYLRRATIALKYYAWAFVGLVVPLIPFIVFELRHNFVNTNTALRFVLQRDNSGQTNLSIRDFGKHVNDVFVRLFWRLVIVQNAEITKVFIASLVAGVLLWVRRVRHKNKKILNATIVLLLWFVVGLVMFGIYQGTVFDYYFVPLFPMPFLLTGIFFALLWQQRFLGKIASIVLLSTLLWFHVQNWPFQYEPNNQVGNTRQVADFVLQQTGGKPYNFALLADKNSDHAYRYFLEVDGHAPVEIKTPDIDLQRNSVTQQLLVVCEDRECSPLGHPLWEVAGFGQAEIAQQWQVGLVQVFKLVPL